MRPLLPKSLLLRFFMSFLVLTTSTLIVVSLFTYVNYQRQILHESSETSKKMLFQTQLAVEFVKDWVSAHLFQLYSDADLFNAMYGSDISLIDEIETHRKISQGIISNPLIYSIYLYNANTGTVYSSLSTPSDAESFYDRDIFTMLSEPALYRQLRFIPREIDFHIYTTRHQQNMLTVIHTERSTKNQALEGALLLNLRADYVQQIMQSMYMERQNDEFILLDAEGRILSHGDSSRFLDDVSEESYVEKILSASEPSGVFTSMIAGKKYLVTYVSSEKLGWTFLRLTAYSSLLSKTYGLRNLLIIFCAVLFLVVLMLSLWFSRRLYSPIHTLADKIRTQMGTLTVVKEQALMNELDYVSDAFLRVIHHTEDLQQQAESHRTFVFRELLKKILRGERQVNSDLIRTLQELEPKIAPGPIRIASIRIDNYWQGFSQQLQPHNQNLVKLALQDTIQRLMALEYPQTEVVTMGDDLFTVLYNVETSEALSAEDIMQRIIQRIQEQARKNFALTVSASIGGLALSLSELPALYQQVLELSNYKLVYGWESILSLPTLVKHPRDAYAYPQNIEKHLLDALRLRKAEQVEQYLDQLFEGLPALSYGHIITTLSKMLHAAVPVLHTIAAEDSPVQQLSARLLLEDVKRLDRLEDVLERLLQTFQDAMTHERQVLDNVKQQHVDTMLAIIEEDYINPNLNVDEVATRLGLSTNYVRILFKEATNSSLSEYLNQIRFEKARQLLLETDIPVKEVCAKIGIGNVNYFYTAFKKYSGFTPTQFRQNAQKQSPD